MIAAAQISLKLEQTSVISIISKGGSQVCSSPLVPVDGS